MQEAMRHDHKDGGGGGGREQVSSQKEGIPSPCPELLGPKQGPLSPPVLFLGYFVLPNTKGLPLEHQLPEKRDLPLRLKAAVPAPAWV